MNRILHIVFALALLGATTDPANAQSYDLVIANVTVIDGLDGPSRPGTNVYVRAGRIVDITTGPDLKPSDAFVNGTGRFLTPGFIDLHVHFPEDTTVHQAILDRLLEFGVTTILNPGARPGAGVELREQLRRGERFGPRMFTAGPIISQRPAEAGMAGWATEVSTENEIREAVRVQVASGVDYVKLYRRLPPALVAAAIDEAHQHNVQVIGHMGETTWGEAVSAGIDMLVHTGWGTPMDEIVNLEDPATATDTDWYNAYADAPNGDRFRRLTDALVENDVVVVPTLSIHQAAGLGVDATLLPQFRVELAPDTSVADWWSPGWSDRHPQYDVDSDEEAEMMATVYFPGILNIVDAYFDRGVKLGVGTDVGNSWMTPGFVYHHELGLYQDAGIPPRAILTMATRNGAAALGVADDVGTIEIGKRADLLLFRDNPNLDIRNTNSLDAVFRAGKRVEAVGQPYDLVIANGHVMDPESGLDATRHVGISDGTIRAVSEVPLEGLDTIDANGLVVAPGFIDLNTYQSSDPFFRLRAADGVTSVLQLEGGSVDVAAFYAALENRALINYGVGIDHGAMRLIAQGDTTLQVVNGLTDWPGINNTRTFPEMDQRAVTPQEKDSLVAMVDRGFREGAVAIGLGLAYQPGATHSEVLTMIELATNYNASAHLHVRGYDAIREWGELYEVLSAAVFTGGDLHINHLQAVYGGLTEKVLQFIDRGRSFGLSITTECYSHTAGMTYIDSAIFDDWETRSDEELRRFEWPATGERLTRESFGRYRQEGGVVIIHPRNEARQESGVRTCLAHPTPMIASDGAWDDGQTHPRSAGTNSRVLGRYVREQNVLTLMEAIRKMTLAPAKHLERRVPSMSRKGRIRVGADADLVVFDPVTVIDRSTYRDPLLPPDGIEHVLVNGEPVVRKRVLQDGVFPGGPIRGVVTN